MSLEANQRREQEGLIAVSEDRLKTVLHEFKDELFEKIDDKFATKKDVRFYVTIGLLGGPAFATLLTTLITRQSPPEQAQTIVNFVTALF